MQIEVVKEILPYYELMTPKWLDRYASITGNYSLHPQYLELDPTTIIRQPKYQQAIEVKLVPPHTLKSTDNVVIIIIIAMDTKLANDKDHDPSFGISDGKHFIGFTAYDQANYADFSPCQKLEGETTPGLLQNLRSITGPFVSSTSYSSEIKLRFRPTEQWGSCHTEHGEGYVNIADYQSKLDLTKGLYFQMYHEDDAEVYRVKYIEAEVYCS